MHKELKHKSRDESENLKMNPRICNI